MGLGQLARKLALRPAEIVDFLAENNIRIADGANTRLEKDQIILVMKRFVPGWVEEPVSEAEEIVDEEINDFEPAPEPLPSNEPINFNGEPNVEPPLPSETDDVIRAPKIELSGLKVVGKIDLPEPKKKEEPVKTDSAANEDDKVDEGKKERRDRKHLDVNRSRRQRPEKNPIALQREKEAKEEQKKRVEQQARDKEKRTQNYLKNYKPSSPTKAAKLVKEAVVEMSPTELEEPPKTIFGKIMRWLTKAS